MNTFEYLLYFEHKTRHNHHQTSQSYSPAARSSIQKFDNDCDVIFVFKFVYIIIVKKNNR